MTIDDYKNNILNADLDNSIDKVMNALTIVLDTIRSVMIEKDLKHFNYFVGYPPDETISDYLDATDVSLEKWVEQNRPVVAIVYLSSAVANADVEAFSTYDVDCDINIDFIYPHYNYNEYINSTNEMNSFVNTFIEMFEMSGRSWMLNNERIAFDRTPISIAENTYSLYSNVLCHLVSCVVTFKIFKKSVDERLYLWGFMPEE